MKVCSVCDNEIPFSKVLFLSTFHRARCSNCSSTMKIQEPWNTLSFFISAIIGLLLVVMSLNSFGFLGAGIGFLSWFIIEIFIKTMLPVTFKNTNSWDSHS